MPFDAFSSMAVSKNGVETGKLRQLSEALRRELPHDFEWDFRDVSVIKTTQPPILRALFLREKPHCHTAGCALGLARHIGILTGIDGMHGRAVQEGTYSLFGLSKTETGEVFGSNAFYGVEKVHHVLPFMVADAIDRIIAREEAAGL